jgi:putative lipoprotein
MPRLRVLCYALLPLLVGCQSLPDEAENFMPEQRLMGELSVVQDRLRLQPCGGGRQMEVEDAGALNLRQDVDQLLGDGDGRLFADLGGEDLGDRLRATRLYRLQAEGQGCQDADFPRLIARASGNEPFWSVSISAQGLVLQRPGEKPLALPYLEEQLPEGRLYFSSEADGQRLSLWLAPQRCQDEMSGALRHLSAELRLNDQRLTGCAYLGGTRQ